MTTSDLSRPCAECGAEINTECAFFCTARTEHAAEQPDDEPSPDITIADLAAELDTTVRDISERVSHLCREGDPREIVHLIAGCRARTLLHGAAADTIRAQHA